MTSTSTRPAPGRDAGRREGERRRDCVLAVIGNQRAIFVRRARRAFVARLLAAGKATADDVREVVELPPGVNPNLFGAVPSLFRKLGIARLVGFVTSTRPARHAGVNRLWELTGAGAATDWLAKNPDLPDPPADLWDADGQRLLFPLSTNDATPTASTAGAAA